MALPSHHSQTSRSPLRRPSADAQLLARSWKLQWCSLILSLYTSCYNKDKLLRHDQCPRPLLRHAYKINQIQCSRIASFVCIPRLRRISSLRQLSRNLTKRKACPSKRVHRLRSIPGVSNCDPSARYGNGPVGTGVPAR